MSVYRDTFEPAQKIDDIPDEKYNTQSQQKGLILLPVLTVTDSRDLPGPTWQIDCVPDKKYDTQLMRIIICKINKI